MRIRVGAITTLAVVFGGVSGCGGAETAETAIPVEPAAPTKPDARFERLTVDAQADGPAFAEIADLDGDGKLDIIVTRFGSLLGGATPRRAGGTLSPGSIMAYLQGATLKDWTQSPILSPEDGVYWPNDATLHDVDGDGDLDAIVGTGFLVCAIFSGVGPCGGLLWFEQRDGGWVRHDVVSPTSALFYHKAVPVDFDGDGIEDLVTVGEERPTDGVSPDRAEAQWFKGTGEGDRFETSPRVIGPGMGSIPTVMDIDGDGDLDVASAELFAGMGASFAWYERVGEPSPTHPAGEWLRHVIDAGVGPAIQLSFIENLLGDGRLMAVGSNHTNTAKDPADPWESAVYLYDIPPDPRQPWSRTRISEGVVSLPGSPAAPQGAPGIFGWGDADGDGDLDLVVSGDGDPRVLLLEQTAPGAFATRVLDDQLPQAGGMKIADLDGDGAAEIVVCGYKSNGVYVYHRSEGGAHPLTASTPAPAVEPSDLTFEVRYDGALEGNVLVALFASYPPTGPPDGYAHVEGPDFPIELTLEAVPPGEYTALVVLDAAPYDPQLQGSEDVQTLVEISVPLAAKGPVVVTLSGGAPTPPPVPTEKTDVTISVSYDGPGAGQIVCGAFPSLPPTGPPLAFTMATPEAFPATIIVNKVPAGTTQFMAFLDLEPLSPTFPGPEDPIATSDPMEVEGGAPMTIELTLTLPDQP